MRSKIKGFYFFQCCYNLVLFKMQSYCGGKLLKKFAEPTEFEIQIGNTIHDLEVNSDLKDLRGLSIVAANEVDVGDKKCIVLFVAVPMLNAFKKFQQKIVRELEKKCIVLFVAVPMLNAFKKSQQKLVRELEKKLAGKHVVLIAQRRILPKEKKGQKRILSQKRPKSRTLTSVHTCILDDLVYPSDIVGKRIRVRLDGSRLFKVHLDKSQQTNMEHKVETFSAVYRKLTGKEVTFEFREQFF